MQIACQTILWGRKLSNLEEVFAAIAAEGFQGVEIAQRPDLLGGINAHQLRDLLKHFELSLIGMAGGSLSERVEFARDVFPGIYLYIERFDVADEPDIKEAIHAGFRIAVHPHLFKWTETFEQAIELMRRHPKLFLLPDPAHLRVAGDDLDLVVDRMPWDRVAAIHLKDWTPEYGRVSHRYARGFTELGKGVVGVARFLARVLGHYASRSAAQTPWLVFEQDSTRLDIAECLRVNANWLRANGVSLIPRPRAGPAPPYVPAAPKPTRRFSDAERAALYSGLLNASQRGQRYFFSEVARLLQALMKCRYASIWSCATANDFLCLKAIYPDDLTPDLHFDTTPALNRTLSQDAVDAHRTRAFDLLKSGEAVERSANRDFLLARGLSAMISIPVLDARNANHIRYLINLFSDDEMTEEALRDIEADDEYNEIAQAIAIAADKMLDDVCFAVAGKVDLIDPNFRKVHPYLDALRVLIAETFKCEGVAIFKVNEFQNQLLEETSEPKTEWQDPSRPYYVRGSGSFVGEAWEKNQFRLMKDLRHVGESREVLRSLRDERLIGAIASGRLNARVLGVVRCTNKRASQTRTVSTMFSVDDAAVLESMVQAAAPRLELLLNHEQRIGALDRLTSNLTDPLVALRDIKPVEDPVKMKDAGRLLYALVRNTWYLCEEVRGLTPRPEWCSLDKMWGMAKERCAFLLRHDRIVRQQVSIDSGMPEVHVDEDMLTQVFFNLLSNAIKFHKPETGKVSVRVWAGGRRDTGLSIFVRDEGIGIEAGAEESLFREGVRGNNHAIRHGQGIGLFLSRRMLAAHGGQIAVRTPPSPYAVAGTTLFEIHLPSDKVAWKGSIYGGQT